MALTYSNTMSPGTTAPSFTLPDAVSGKMLSLDALKSDKATVILFICNHCPYVKHIAEKLSLLAKTYQAKQVSFIAINANNATSYPEDSPEHMKQEALRLGYTFPYLYDESQVVARAYDAACTPEFYVFDQALRCTYHGRFDEATPGNGVLVTGKDLQNAIDATLAGKPILEQHPSMGCNIKWK